MNCFPNKCDFIFDALYVSSLVVRVRCFAVKGLSSAHQGYEEQSFCSGNRDEKILLNLLFPKQLLNWVFFLLQEEVAAKAHGCCLQYAFPSYPYSFLPKSYFLHSSPFSELLEAPGSQFQASLTKKLGFPVIKTAEVLMLCRGFCRKYSGMLNLVFFPLCILEEGI